MSAFPHFSSGILAFPRVRESALFFKGNSPICIGFTGRIGSFVRLDYLWTGRGRVYRPEKA
jgi:hypothetical protein